MNVIQDIATEPTPGVELVDTPDALSAIRGPHCAAAIWQRSLLPELQTWIDGLPPERLPRARIVVRPERVRDAALRVCEDAGTPDGPERDMLIDDIAALSARFAELMEVPYLRLRLDVVTTNACRKFHIDAVTARLVCTYRGTGTQYGVSPGRTDPEKVYTVPTGAPVILRGTLWPTQPNSGLLHRSPPIEGTGETRLLLVLDPVRDLEDALENEVMH